MGVLLAQVLPLCTMHQSCRSAKERDGSDEDEQSDEGDKRGKKRDIREERREELEAIRREKRAYGKTSTAGGHEVCVCVFMCVCVFCVQ